MIHGTGKWCQKRVLFQTHPRSQSPKSCPLAGGDCIRGQEDSGCSDAEAGETAGVSLSGTGGRSGIAAKRAGKYEKNKSSLVPSLSQTATLSAFLGRVMELDSSL